MLPIYSIKNENQAFDLSVHPPFPDTNTAEREKGNSGNAEHSDSEWKPEIHQSQPGGEASKQAHQHDQFGKLDFLCGLLYQYGLFHNSSRFPVAGYDDLCSFRQMIHCVDPRLNSRTVRQAEIRQKTIVEAGISLQPVDIRPVLDRDLYQFDCDLRFPRRDKCRESPSRVIERSGNRCDSAGNGIPAEVFIPFAGTECAVCGVCRMRRSGQFLFSFAPPFSDKVIFDSMKIRSLTADFPILFRIG